MEPDKIIIKEAIPQEASADLNIDYREIYLTTYSKFGSTYLHGPLTPVKLPG